MELADQVESLDAVPEPFRPFYSEAEGGFRLDDKGFTGAVTNYHRLTGEKKTLATQKAELEKKLKAYEGIDEPAKAKEALVELQQLKDQIAAQGAGTTPDEVEKLLEQRVERMKKDNEAQLAALKKEAERLAAEKGESDNRYTELLIESQITQTVTKLPGFNQACLPDLLRLARAEFTIEDGRAVKRNADGELVYGASGKEPLTLEEWGKALPQERPYMFFANANGGGATASGNGAGGAKTISRAAMRALTPAQQMAKTKEGWVVTE